MTASSTPSSGMRLTVADRRAERSRRGRSRAARARQEGLAGRAATRCTTAFVVAPSTLSSCGVAGSIGSAYASDKRTARAASIAHCSRSPARAPLTAASAWSTTVFARPPSAKSTPSVSRTHLRSSSPLQLRLTLLPSSQLPSSSIAALRTSRPSAVDASSTKPSSYASSATSRNPSTWLQVTS